MRRGFLAEVSKDKKAIDNVFLAVKDAIEAKKKHGTENVIDATLGVLINEKNELCTLPIVWSTYQSIPSVQKAKYASSFQGDDAYKNSIEKWLFDGINKKFKTGILATPGGSGALSNTFRNYLDRGEKLVIPNICWGPYKIMAKEYGLESETYEMFDGDSFNIESLKQVCNKVMEKQGKVLLVINDPCHNPTGYSLTTDEWISIMKYLNELSIQGPVVLLNDIAYIDYTYIGKDAKKYFELYNDINDNLLVVLAFSCSKALTAYGLRVGAQIAISNCQETINEFLQACTYSSRCTWSNVNNGGMVLLSTLVLDEVKNNQLYNEQRFYANVLRKRAEVFIEEAKSVGLPIYPYKEGFFATIKVDNDYDVKRYYDALKSNNIFTVKVDGGLRVALCGLPSRYIGGFATKIYNTINNI